MTGGSNPVWILEILKITIPVIFGGLIWAAQTLIQRGWREFEHRRDVYTDIVQSIDAFLYSQGDGLEARAYPRIIRKAWLVGSDEVIRAANSLSASIRDNESAVALRDDRYWQLIDAMRQDLRHRRWLPPKGTLLGRGDFQLGYRAANDTLDVESRLIRFPGRAVRGAAPHAEYADEMPVPARDWR